MAEANDYVWVFRTPDGKTWIEESAEPEVNDYGIVTNVKDKNVFLTKSNLEVGDYCRIFKIDNKYVARGKAEAKIIQSLTLFFNILSKDYNETPRFGLTSPIVSGNECRYEPAGIKLGNPSTGWHSTNIPLSWIDNNILSLYSVTTYSGVVTFSQKYVQFEIGTNLYLRIIYTDETSENKTPSWKKNIYGKAYEYQSYTDQIMTGYDLSMPSGFWITSSHICSIVSDPSSFYSQSYLYKKSGTLEIPFWYCPTDANPLLGINLACQFQL